MALPVLIPLLCAVPLTAQTQFAASAAPTRFSATNPNAYTVLLVLGDETDGACTQMLMAPGASFETYFPSGTLDGVFMEVVCFTPTGRTTSGAVDFATLLAPGASTLTVELEAGVSAPWIETTSGKFPADSGVDLVSPAFIALQPANATQLLDPNHVPVLTPNEVETNNAAPKIQRTNPPV